LGYIVLLLLTAVGLWAVWVRFAEGLMVTDLTQHVPWGLWISLYIYFIGLSAGSFLLSTLVYVFRIKRFEPVGPLALLQALGCLMTGMALIWIDLGHPWRFLNIFLYWNPTSVMAWEALFYAGYSVILLVELYLVFKPALSRRVQAGGPWVRLSRVLSLGGGDCGATWQARAGRLLLVFGIIGIPVAIGVHGGTGAIFAVVKSRPTWYTGLFPIVFLVSALASGGALLTFLTAATSRLPETRKLDLLRGLARMTVGILALDLLLTASETLVVFYGGIPQHIAGWKYILFGQFWWVFWFIQLGLGAVVPILIVAGRRTGRSIAWLGLSGLLVAIGVVGVRLNIVIPAQMEPELPGLADAYHQMRFAQGYFPSANEWLVSLLAIALVVWAFLLARKILPLAEVEKTGLASAGALCEEQR
jgi:molybdopterin-containing oxidoreductase family membrane subunit